jgi:hypothetical protein
MDSYTLKAMSSCFFLYYFPNSLVFTYSLVPGHLARVGIYTGG